MRLNFQQLGHLDLCLDVIYVSLVCARGKDVWGAARGELAPISPAVLRAEVGARRGRQVARKTMESWCRECRPAAAPGCAVRGRSTLPAPVCAPRVGLLEGAVECLGVVTETSPAHSSINAAPVSVYRTHSASFLADWDVNDSRLFVCYWRFLLFCFSYYICNIPQTVALWKNASRDKRVKSLYKCCFLFKLFKFGKQAECWSVPR